MPHLRLWIGVCHIWSFVASLILDMHVGYDRIILPQKNSAGRSAWCISLLEVDLLLPASPRIQGLDDFDLGILQLLSEGIPTREIASAVRLSPRTVEHRIEWLKSSFGAKNIAHLIALVIAGGLSDAGRRKD